MRPAPPIDSIVQAIVNRVHPRRVILFGSRARGNARPDSDVDLMVEMETVARRSERIRQIQELFPERDWSMDVVVYTPQEVQTRRDDPGTMVYAIEREGRVLYSQPGLEPPSVQVREQPPEPESVAAWIRNAEMDLLDIKNNTAAEEIPWPTVCYHAQQAAEKYLKSLIIRRWERPGRTHDLSEILLQCRQLGDPLPGLDADCALLVPYAVTPQYQDDEGGTLLPLPSADEGREAVAAMERIVAAARVVLEKKPLAR